MTTMPRRLSRQLPPGVHDIFGGAAHQLRNLSSSLHHLFDCWGYTQVLPPTFEYFDNVMRAFDEEFAARIYRFIDPDGQLLALRPDLTVGVARLVATKLYDQPMPQRLSYVAPVFRFAEPNNYQPRQLWQGGWELIGVASPAADAEVIALMITALEEAGLEQFQLNLGHTGFVRATLNETKINEPLRAELLRAIDRKNRKVLWQTLQKAGIEGQARTLLGTLPELWGGQEVLQKALSLAPNRLAVEAIEYLQAVFELLEAYGVTERVTIDLGEVRGMDYYTGIIFEVFAAGSGFTIASGGRYDKLLARFGADLPAVGGMIKLEHVINILNQTYGSPTRPIPDALHQQCDDPRSMRTLLKRRRHGERIELDLKGRSLEELYAEAARRGIPEVIPCR